MTLNWCLRQEVRGQAYAHWLAAAGVPGSHQPAAFAKLGLWYADFKADAGRARKCFQRALGLNPLQAEAGQLLCIANLIRIQGVMPAYAAMVSDMCVLHVFLWPAVATC